jgi:hypothetical protein
MFLPSLIALDTDGLQSGGIANDKFTLAPYTSFILDTVFAKNMPRRDVTCKLDFLSLYVTLASSLPSSSEEMGAFLWAVKADDCTSNRLLPKRQFIMGTVDSPEI